MSTAQVVAIFVVPVAVMTVFNAALKVPWARPEKARKGDFRCGAARREREVLGVQEFGAAGLMLWSRFLG